MNTTSNPQVAPTLAAPTPPRYKLMILSWLAIYPLITWAYLLFGQELHRLPLPLRTFVLTGVLVYLMTYWVMPLMMAAFRTWLIGKPGFRGGQKCKIAMAPYFSQSSAVDVSS
jgi:antibiotic biosynthesis monooxygenase (ABM) superfamily enzyme